MCLVSFESWELILHFLSSGLMKQSVTVGDQLLWSGRYGCNNGRYGCTIVMSYIEINKAVSQWLLTFNLCVSVTWPLTCAFHIPCTHTPEIIDMHRGMCDKIFVQVMAWWHQAISLYLSHCWPRSLLPYGITGPQWGNEFLVKKIQQAHVPIYFFSTNKVEINHTYILDCWCKININWNWVSVTFKTI